MLIWQSAACHPLPSHLSISQKGSVSTLTQNCSLASPSDSWGKKLATKALRSRNKFEIFLSRAPGKVSLTFTTTKEIEYFFFTCVTLKYSLFCSLRLRYALMIIVQQPQNITASVSQASNLLECVLKIMIKGVPPLTYLDFWNAPGRVPPLFKNWGCIHSAGSGPGERYLTSFKFGLNLCSIQKLEWAAEEQQKKKKNGDNFSREVSKE